MVLDGNKTIDGMNNKGPIMGLYFGVLWRY